MSLTTIALAFGLVLVLEGLVFALAPSRIEELLRMMAQLPLDARRMIGALAIVLGILIITATILLAG